MIAIDVRDGSVRWRQPSSIHAYDAVIHPDGSAIYVTSLLGTIEAFSMPSIEESGERAAAGSSLEPAWQTKLDRVGFPTLIPLPGGGVLVSTRRGVLGVSPDGNLLWKREAPTWVTDWALVGDRLILSGADGTTWVVGEEGPVPWAAAAGGHLAVSVSGDRVLAYDEEGIHRLDPEARSAERLYALPGSFPSYGDVVALSDGSVLVAHRDTAGGTLIVLAADGTLRWRRSYAGLLTGQRRLLVLGDRVYLMSKHSMASSGEVSIYEVDVERAELVRIFVGGSRDPSLADTWAAEIGGDRLLIQIGGTGMLALDVPAARGAIGRP